MKILAGPLAGMEIFMGPAVTRAYVLGVYEVAVTKALEALCKPGMVACDIGAHQGYFTLLLARLVGPDGRVYAFEPMPGNYHSLERTLRINHLNNVVQAIPLAVAQESGDVLFQYSDKATSTGNIVHAGNDSTNLTSERKRVALRAVSLDDYAQEVGIQRIDLIKMDIEGEELNALRGMQWVLSRMRPVIVCEVHGKPIGRDPGAVLQFLLDLGYALHDIVDDQHPMVNPDGFTGGHVLGVCGNTVGDE
ncbi:MAG: FkbM family methyltransferase [Anaerolineae bacterium]